MIPFVVLSGCSGGGKSALLDELARRGHPVIPEAGRRIVQEECHAGGQALPWLNMPAFLERTLRLARQDYAQAPRDADGWVFFDRSLIDAAAAWHEHADRADLSDLPNLTRLPRLARLSREYRYHPQVFLTPPWPEIYVQDAERRHDMQAAQAEYQRLLLAYPALGYTVHVLPKVSIAQRADLILKHLSHHGRTP